MVLCLVQFSNTFMYFYCISKEFIKLQKRHLANYSIVIHNVCDIIIRNNWCNEHQLFKFRLKVQNN